MSALEVPAAGRYQIVYGRQNQLTKGTLTQVVKQAGQIVCDEEHALKPEPFAQEPQIETEAPGKWRVTYYLRSSDTPPRSCQVKIVAAS